MLEDQIRIDVFVEEDGMRGRGVLPFTEMEGK
jgi:hypothetical protein